MKKSYIPNLYLALAHYPVVNKNGSTIASAVTNLDLHDISRAAKTYGARSLYIVTPLSDQKRFVEKITDHWVNGYGSTYNPERKKALELIRIKSSMDDVVEDIQNSGKGRPKVVATCARNDYRNITYDKLGKMIQKGEPFLLVFGTAWGLAKKYITSADYILEPIKGNTGYNHLSVRSAAAIMLDRLMRNNY